MGNHYGSGSIIQQLRKERGYTKRELGTMLGVKGRTVSKWENGAAAPQEELLSQLSTALGCTREELLSGSRRENKSAGQESGQDITAEYREVVKRCNCCRHGGLKFRSLINSSEEKGVICKECGAELCLEKRTNMLYSVGISILKYILILVIWLLVDMDWILAILHVEFVDGEWIQRICKVLITLIIYFVVDDIIFWLIGKLAPYRKHLRIVRYPHPEDGKIVF